MKKHAIFLVSLLLIGTAVRAQSTDELIKQASQAYGRKQFAQSAALYETAFAAGSDDYGAAFEAACCYALIGVRDKAFEFLKKAGELGWSDVDHARTFSAAEDFLVAFDQSGRGTIIGEPSGGSTGNPLRFSLPGGGAGFVCSKHNTYADGREFVGVGVKPQIVVSPTIVDYRAGKDTVLERAVAEIGKIRPNK